MFQWNNCKYYQECWWTGQIKSKVSLGLVIGIWWWNMFTINLLKSAPGRSSVLGLNTNQY